MLLNLGNQAALCGEAYGLDPCTLRPAPFLNVRRSFEKGRSVFAWWRQLLRKDDNLSDDELQMEYELCQTLPTSAYPRYVKSPHKRFLRIG